MSISGSPHRAEGRDGVRSRIRFDYHLFGLTLAMWLLSNATPFAAERTWVRDRNGAEIWIVAVKGSFVIRPNGSQALDEQQSEIVRVPMFAGQPGMSSLLSESDLVESKSATDVLLIGQAFSPGGKPTTQVDVRLKVANVDKTIRVIGDRTIEQAPLRIATVLSAPQPFTELPITYERAFGGTDQRDKDAQKHGWEPRNPVGVGFATSMSHIVGTPAPNIESPRAPYQDWRSGTPVGFGPIARHWQPRVRFVGTYDERWRRTRDPLVPDDFDNRFFQCAPEDQQVPGFLKGGELVELSHLTPDGYLAFRLPKVTFGFTTRFYDGSKVTHRAQLHTVTLQPDRRRFEMVWHSSLPCHHQEDQLKITRIRLKRRIGVSREEVESGVWIHR